MMVWILPFPFFPHIPFQLGCAWCTVRGVYTSCPLDHIIHIPEPVRPQDCDFSSQNHFAIMQEPQAVWMLICNVCINDLVNILCQITGYKTTYSGTEPTYFQRTTLHISCECGNSSNYALHQNSKFYSGCCICQKPGFTGIALFLSLNHHTVHLLFHRFPSVHLSPLP